MTRLPVRPGALALIALGLAMLALGIWVEDRAAVAAPLAILGALVVVAGVIFDAWADIEEMSVSQSGVTFRRRMPSVEDLTEGGLPEQVAQDIASWMDALTEALPGAIDRRVQKAFKDRAESKRILSGAMRELVERRVQQQREAESSDPGQHG